MVSNTSLYAQILSLILITVILHIYYWRYAKSLLITHLSTLNYHEKYWNDKGETAWLLYFATCYTFATVLLCMYVKSKYSLLWQ